MDENKAFTCCFTGHRAEKLPWRFNERDENCICLKEAIFREICRLYDEGYRCFICGMASGSDLYFAEAVLRLRSQQPEVRLEAAVPYPGQAERWPINERKKYESILSRVNTKTILYKSYFRGCMADRNKYMVNRSSVLLAVYSGENGGTSQTMLYAMRKGLRLIELAPPENRTADNNN